MIGDIKRNYDSKKHSGLLLVFLPNMTGDWAIDMVDYIEYYINVKN